MLAKHQFVVNYSSGVYYIDTMTLLLAETDSSLLCAILSYFVGALCCYSSSFAKQKLKQQCDWKEYVSMFKKMIDNDMKSMCFFSFTALGI